MGMIHSCGNVVLQLIEVTKMILEDAGTFDMVLDIIEPWSRKPRQTCWRL